MKMSFSQRCRRRARRVGLAAAALGLFASLPAAPALAVNALTVSGATLERPTLMTLGVQVPISGDDNFNGRVTVRYRKNDSCGQWRAGMDLFRVHAEKVTGIAVSPQFAGSLFNLEPNTEYEIELTATDPEGATGATTQRLVARTRAVPRANPANPVTVNVATSSALSSALSNALPGQVITLNPNTTYTGLFTITRSGTADNPIVIRGSTGSIIDGNQNCPSTCTSGPVLWVKGSHVYVENVTLQNARKGIYLGQAASQGQILTTDNVVRRVTVRNVKNGITSAADQTDFYVCDNDVQGVLAWPNVYGDDGGANANLSGVRVSGSGHVVCHNTIKGFGDAIRLQPDESPENNTSQIRAVDIYGNDVRTGYDNGLELDYGISNVRAFRNRFLNTWATISFQPIYGGPAYAMRNVIVNVVREPLKFSNNTSGMLVLHNTVVPAPMTGRNGWLISSLSLVNGNLVSHDFSVLNNLFIGRSGVSGGRTVYWFNGIDDGTFDYNGYYPDGIFHFGDSTATDHPNFASLQLNGGALEDHGLLAPSNVFANGMSAPASYTTEVQPSGADVTLNPTANPVIDVAFPINNVNGAAPDLGALESGCLTAATYGPRPSGTDESNEVIGCEGARAVGCSGDTAGPPSSCGPAPASGCDLPTWATIRMRRYPGVDDGNSLSFQWKKGAVDLADLGDPLSSANYSLCIYAAPVNGTPTLLSSSVMPAGGQTCGATCSAASQCWRPSPSSTPTKWTYKDTTNSPDGIYSMQIVSGEPTRTKIRIKGRSDCLDLPASLQIADPVKVQVKNSQTGACWEVNFGTGVYVQTPTQYTNKFDIRHSQ